MSEMSKVEEVALAIAEKYHGRKVTREYLLGEATGGLVFIECAKASIEAMRVPTAAMLAAGSFAIEGLTEEDAKRLGEEEHFQSGAWRAEEVLSAMLDAALKE